MRGGRALFGAVLALLPLVAGAANVVTDGEMENAGITSWPHTSVLGGNSSAKATDQRYGASGQSLKGTAQLGKNANREWYNAQTIGTVNAGSTVTLTFWWGVQHLTSASATASVFYVEAKPTASAWGDPDNILLHSVSSPGSMTFASGNVTALDVSSLFTASQSYDLRLRFTGRLGGTNNSGLVAWWDHVILDVTENLDATTVGTVAASGSGCNGIAVSAPYTNDLNGNNTLSYRTRTPTGTGTWSSPTNLAHSASPYSFTIPSLTAGATYDVEVTYSDSNGVNGTNPQTVSNITVGANCTSAGTVTAAQTTGATPSIAVSAPYTGDSNNNNTLSYRTRTPSGTGTWSAATPVSHSGSPYSFDISGLACGSAYDVEVTYLDADGIGSGTAVQTVTNVQLTNCTVAGTATAVQTPGATPSILVTAPYSSDGNTNNTLSYRTRTPTGTGTWTTPTAVPHSASPFSITVSGLACASSYDVEVTYQDADAVGGTALQTITNVVINNCTTAGTASATVNSCSQITVSAPFTNNVDGDGSVQFEQGSSGTGPWSAIANCGAVGGVSPRNCVNSGLTANTPYWYRVTYTDPDAVAGSAQQTIGSYTTPTCATPQVTVGTVTATATGCTTATVTAPFTGDSPTSNSTTRVEWSTGGTWTTSCAALTAASPRTCNVTGLPAGTLVTFRVTFTDADGIFGTNPQSPTATTTACNVTAGTPSATANSCNQIKVTAPFTGDTNDDSTTSFKRGNSASGPFNTTVCSAVATASPRECVDNTVAASTTYHYQVDYVDVDGVVGDLQVASATTPACPPVVTLSDPGGQPVGVAVSAGNTTDVGRVTFTANTGTVTVTSIGVTNPTGTAVPNDDILRLQLFDNSTGDLIGTTVWNGTSYRASGLSFAVAAGTPRTVRVAMTVATGATTGRTFRMQLASANVTASGGSTVTGGPVNGSTTLFSTAAGPLQGNALPNAPTVLFLNPINGAAVTGPSFRVQVQVYDPNGLGGITEVSLSTNGGSTFGTPLTQNASYTVGTNAGIYQAVVTLTPGSYGLVARAINATGTTRTGLVAVTVKSAGVGDGALLVRDNSSQLCTDCHALQSHSSQGTGGKYGAWAVTCRDCHTPHSTTNVSLIKKTIIPPSLITHQSAKAVKFSKKTGATSSAAIADATYANPDNSGTCQVCHTQTKSLDGTKTRFRNSGNADGHFAAGATERCTNCHTHATGFKGKMCVECHLDPTTDVDNFAADSTPAKVSESEWLAYGHGKTSGLYPDGNTAAAFDTQGATVGDRGCAYCHDSGTGHNQAGNRFRLANIGGADGKNGACLVCHKSGSAGFDPDGTSGTAYANKAAAKKIDANHAGVKHYPNKPAPNENGGTYCWDCHDPHGDLSALGNPLWFMLHKQPVRNTDAEGLPTAFANPIEFRQEAGGNRATDPITSSTKLDFQDYVVSGRALCGNCHTSAGANPVNYYTSDAAFVRHRDSNGTQPNAPNDRCTDCHAHNSMFNPPRCDSCHASPPTVGKHAQHDPVPESIDSMQYDNVTPHGTATTYGFACAQCHSGGHANNGSSGLVGDPYEVEVIFSNGGTGYTPSTAQSEQGPGGKYYSYSNGTCAAYCHSNASPLPTGTATYASPTWQQVATMTCTSCHGTGGAASTLSPAHRLHTDAAKYNYGCVRCHTATVSGNTTVSDKTFHVNGAKDVVFDTGGSYAGSPNYTCASTACHVNGAGGPQVGALSWNTAGGGFTCDQCHGSNAAQTNIMATGKHTFHVNNAGVIGTNLGCVKCHSATVSADTTIGTFSNHVNGTVNVAGASLTYNAPTCTNTYCHSSGQATPTYRTVRWDDAVWTSVCTGCHGTTTQNGAPDYGTGNSHARHVASGTAGRADCTKCHNDTTTADGTAILAGSALHLNSARDVTIAAAYDLSLPNKADNYNSGTKTCSSVSCHGSAGTPVWGGTVTCLGCHSGALGGTLGDGTPNGVGTYWSTRGHGAAAGGALSSARGGCDYCHQLNAGHTPTDPTNPYRLRYSANTNALCNQCHLTGDTGISQDSDGVNLSGGLEDGTLDIDAAHDGTRHQAGEGGILCWDCHDPHGVQTNIKMVKHQVSVTANQYGVPGVTRTVNFTDNTTAGQAPGRFTEATNNPRQGICQACHDPTKGTDQTLGSSTNWRWDGTDATANPSTHNASGLCSGCHAHKSKFAGAGGDCLGCHKTGGQATGAPYNKRPVEVDFGKKSHHVGAMNSYPAQTTMGGALTNFDCVVCHAEGTVSAGEVGADSRYHKNQKIDLKDVDSADPANPAVFVYDKAAVATAAGAVANWGSINATWRYETSGKNETTGALDSGKGLDRFCLTCHDSNGASTVYVQGDTGATAMNPFKDLKISNEVDKLDRGPNIVDIKSMVTGAPPPKGLYSRHAIRGQSASRYTSSTIAQSLRSATYNALLNIGVTDPWDPNTPTKQTLWNDTSTMGCADCHTTDGANGATGNAHGGDGEYLLKDKNGTGAISNNTADATTTIICMRCHAINVGGGTTHSNSGSNFISTVGLPAGTAKGMRAGGSGNQYGIFCMNCHGGAATYDTGLVYDAAPANADGFGRIHGTDQVFKVGSGGTNANPRRAYRFTNGASLRYYQPGDTYTTEWNWESGSGTCFTLGVSTDSWSTCAQHSGAKAYTKQGTRPLNY